MWAWYLTWKICALFMWTLDCCRWNSGNDDDDAVESRTLYHCIEREKKNRCAVWRFDFVWIFFLFSPLGDQEQPLLLLLFNGICLYVYEWILATMWMGKCAAATPSFVSFDDALSMSPTSGETMCENWIIYVRIYSCVVGCCVLAMLAGFVFGSVVVVHWI